jgi:hypothetical protein
MEIQPTLYSEINLKITSCCIIKLILSGDQKLNFNISKEIITSSSQKVTRKSGQKKIIEIPFIVQAFSLLVKMYHYIMTETKKNSSLLYGDEEEDEDEDEENDFQGQIGEGISGLTPKDLYGSDSDTEDDVDPYLQDDEFNLMNLQNLLKDGLKQIYQKQKNVVESSIQILEKYEVDLLKTLLQ